MSAALSAIAAGVAVWFALPGTGGVRRLRATPAERRVRARVRWRWAGGAGVGVGLVAFGAASWGAPGVVVALAACLAGGTAARVLSRQWARRARAARRAEVVRVGDLLAGLLRAGRIPATALLEASADAPVLAVAAAELRVGGDPGPALRRQAGVPGQEGLAELAAAWEVAARTGASLVEAVETAAAALAADAEVRRVVAAELSAARTAGRVMALLPVAGLALGHLIGADPLAFLLGHPAGWACLLGGAASACAGVVWIDAVAGGAGGT